MITCGNCKEQHATVREIRDCYGHVSPSEQVRRSLLQGVSRALAAECRAVEEGHHARWDENRRVFLVVSDSKPGRTYEVTAQALVLGNGSARIRFTCTCPAGRHASGRLDVPCKHSALVARRLERTDLAVFDATCDTWRPKPLLLQLAGVSS